MTLKALEQAAREGSQKSEAPAATMGDAVAVGRLAWQEAERRGLSQAVQVLILAD